MWSLTSYEPKSKRFWSVRSWNFFYTISLQHTFYVKKWPLRMLNLEQYFCFPLQKKHLSSLLIQLNVTIVTVQDNVNVRPKNSFFRSKKQCVSWHQKA